MARRFFLLTAAVISICSLGSKSVFAQAAAANPAPAKSPFETMTVGTKKVDGLWTMYHKDQQLLVEISPSQLNQNFLVLTSIAKGISAGPVLGGMTWGFGNDEVIWSFVKVGDKLHVLRRNVRFRAN